MSYNVFSGGRTKESVAYDLALALAAKELSSSTPGALIERIADLLPECRSVAESKFNAEVLSPFTVTISC
ncbi:hypothetical protein FMK81_12785 [Klebsiella oxytoca]|uniref:hypothetical protein n=1 Tax=Klebsiella TaxID=570 RepID=UPI000E3EC728|nr:MULTISPECIES: hypothetical protein [Klebsiella]MBW6033952.1 hypothetical protein [Klebsiella sp. CVUAS 11332]MBX4822870.1 hypothetical protein [Klebsiella michiganensis]MBZ6568882.1 hypothetical protein [Klebsiella grimontii]MBZ7262386.1 hypothetical protein [Klebsiella oxytoca]MBZ7375194.1 hypothetical protein [Klebsiella grimontii]